MRPLTFGPGRRTEREPGEATFPNPPRPIGPDFVHPESRRGRGALTNASGRFEPLQKHPIDDGWDTQEPTPLRTEVSIDATRSIIARNQSPDIGFEQSINAYRGCEHGCIYCYARPTHAYLGLSPGLDFESRLFVKPDAARLLEQELRKPGYACAVIAIGTNTDPYQPIEREWRITRQILEVLLAFRHPVEIVTKSALVLRDLDILIDMAKDNLVKVFLSVTTLNRELARRMEPRAPTPSLRLHAIEELAKAGVPVGVMVAPVIPDLTDYEMESILKDAATRGAVEAGYVPLRLPLEIKDLWRDWLNEHYPDRAGKIMTLLRSMREGREYKARWGLRMRGSGPYADMLRTRFRLACAKLGLNSSRLVLDCGKFRVPGQRQLSLL
jgi:DNA repair photolyase